MSTIADHYARALDPALFVIDAFGMKPDGWQARTLRSTSERILLNCHRQAGKSTIGAGLALHTALYNPNSLTLMVSPTERQSKEIFRKCIVGYRALGRPIDPEAENQLSLELESGSRIVALPGKEDNLRAFSGVRLLIIDEAARVPDVLYEEVVPMLAVSGGRVIGMSTPKGRRGWFYKAWDSEDDWEKVEVPVTECKRIKPEFLERFERERGRAVYEREYLCKFEDPETQVFSSTDIDAALDKGVRSWGLLSSSWV